MADHGLTRRTLGGVAVLGAGLPVLAACGGESGAGAAVDPVPERPTSSPEPVAPSAPTGPLATTSDVPVGGGTIFADAGVVVTQPAPGELKAFSATCTHQGCAVNEVVDGAILCPCHSSSFSIATGAPLQGPAVTPLAAVEITVTGDKISLA